MNIESYQTESGCFPPRALGLTTRYSPDVKAVSLILPKLLLDVYNLNVLFCRRQQNNFRYTSITRGLS